MGLFTGMKRTKERQKAKSFYERSASLPPTSRETRKLRSVLGNRTTAFIDLTFIDGAKRTEAYIEATHVALAPAPYPPRAARLPYVFFFLLPSRDQRWAPSS